MTIAFVGDAHLGNFARHGGLKELGMNERCRLTVATLKRALSSAQQAGAQAVVLLGDLFDTMRPEPQLIAAVRHVFRAFEQSGLRIVLLKGNHDSASDEPGDTALYACTEKNAIVVDKPAMLSVGRRVLVLVPFRSGRVGEWLPTVLRELDPPKDAELLLCLHAGIRDDETAAWLQDAPDSIHVELLSTLMDEFEISHCFAGNWHEHKIWAHLDIHQVGALCPTGFSNLGIDEYGHVAIYRSTEQVEYVRVPGPRFLKLGPKESPATLPKDAGHLYYVEWRVRPGDYERAKAQLEQLIAQGAIKAGSVLPDTAEAREGLEEAAKLAKKAAGLEQALEAYIGELQMPEHVTPDTVKARVRTYLGL